MEQPPKSTPSLAAGGGVGGSTVAAVFGSGAEQYARDIEASSPSTSAFAGGPGGDLEPSSAAREGVPAPPTSVEPRPFGELETDDVIRGAAAPPPSSDIRAAIVARLDRDDAAHALRPEKDMKIADEGNPFEHG
jgi:hypothetical protein